MNNIPIPICSEVKYLSLTLDKKLTCNLHIKNKLKSLKARLHLLNSILQLKLNINNKFLIYKSQLKQIWTYSIQLWRTAKTLQYQKNSSLPIHLSPTFLYTLVYKKTMTLKKISKSKP